MRFLPGLSPPTIAATPTTADVDGLTTDTDDSPPPNADSTGEKCDLSTDGTRQRMGVPGGTPTLPLSTTSTDALFEAVTVAPGIAFLIFAMNSSTARAPTGPNLPSDDSIVAFTPPLTIQLIQTVQQGVESNLVAKHYPSST